MLQLNQEEMLKTLKLHHLFFDAGKTKDINFRIQQLLNLKQMIKANEQTILQALAADLHKSEYEGFTTEVGVLYLDIGHAIKNIRKWAKPQRVKTPLMLFGNQSIIYPEPYGTVLIIGPFNYPFNLIFEPLIGAISAGNCAIIKPSELTPNVSNVIKEIVKQYFEDDYIRVIEGEQEVTSTLINTPFDYIFFTGSANVGKKVMEAAAKNLVPVTLELGGKSPCIIDETADIEKAAQKIAWGKFSNAGQTCVAPDYLVVHSQVKNRLIESLIKCLSQYYGANPKESKDFGRIINVPHTERLALLIDQDKVVVGGDFDIKEQYIAPTLLDPVEWDDSVMIKEIFGPILPIIEYKELDPVIRSINDRPRPLALYLFTKNKETEKRILSQLSYGGGCVNDVLIHGGNPYLPFGGVGSSGIGSYHGKYSFDTFSHMKSITRRKLDISATLVHPPYNERQLNLTRRFLK